MSRRRIIADNMTSIIDLLIIIGAVFVVLLPIVVHGAIVRRLRKQKRIEHPLVRLDDFINLDATYACTCNTGGRIILGKRIVKWMTVVIVVIPLVLLLLFALHNKAVILFLLIIVVVYGNVYRQIYYDMRKYHHDTRCSRRTAIAALPYQIRNVGGFRVIKPKASISR